MFGFKTDIESLWGSSTVEGSSTVPTIYLFIF